MAVYEGVPGPTTYLAMVLNNWIQRRRVRRVEVATEQTQMRARWVNSFVRIVLHIVGFSALTNAMFHWNIIAGWCAVAVSCFIFSWLFTGGSEPASGDNGQMRR